MPIVGTVVIETGFAVRLTVKEMVWEADAFVVTNSKEFAPGARL
jgi:hypothetical protein